MFGKVNAALGRRIRDETEAEHAIMARKRYEEDFAAFGDDLSSWDISSDTSDTKSQATNASSVSVNSGMFGKKITSFV